MYVTVTDRTLTYSSTWWQQFAMKVTKRLAVCLFSIPANKSELCSTKQAQDSNPVRTFLLLILLVSLEIYIFINYISALNCYMMAALRPHFGISFVGKQKAHCHCVVVEMLQHKKKRSLTLSLSLLCRSLSVKPISTAPAITES